jgi:DNA polymerase-3 subunit delta
LLIRCGKLEKQQQSSKWFKELEAVGAVLQVWPLDVQALPGWIRQRLQGRGLQASDEGVQFLAEQVEGNMLAAAQEVEKLVLLYGSGTLSIEQIRDAVADSSRYDVFALADAALAGDAARYARILHGLRGEGEEPVLVLWSLVREVRALAQIAAAQAAGRPLAALLQEQRVWDKRKPLYQAALGRHNLRRWRAFLWRAARLDRICKGAESGMPWDELLLFGLLIAGRRLVYER